jgi:hypothetical protein
MDPRFSAPQPGEPHEDIEHEGEAEGDVATHHAEPQEHAPPYDDPSNAPDETDSESVRPPPERIDD